MRATPRHKGVREREGCGEGAGAGEGEGEGEGEREGGADRVCRSGDEENFSEVSALVHFLCKGIIESTFENVPW